MFFLSFGLEYFGRIKTKWLQVTWKPWSLWHNTFVLTYRVSGHKVFHKSTVLVIKHISVFDEGEVFAVYKSLYTGGHLIHEYPFPLTFMHQLSQLHKTVRTSGAFPANNQKHEQYSHIIQ